MDVVTLAICNKKIAGVLAGIDRIEVDDPNKRLTFYFPNGTSASMNFPIPRDGASITDIKVNEEGYLVCRMSDGTTVVSDDPIQTASASTVSYKDNKTVEDVLDELLESGGGTGGSVDGITVPTKTSDLTNDSGFITSIPSEYITETELETKGYLTEHQDISGLQTKTDDNLATNSKEVIGAINEVKDMADLILDTEVRIDKTYSSSKIYTDIQQCLEDSKTYTLEEIARASTASYKVVTDVVDMTEERYLYLLYDGATNYDIYIVETDGTPTRIGYTQIDISNYYTKEEVDELLEEGGSGVYSTTTPVNNPIGGIKRGDEFTNKSISEIIDLMLHVVERVKVALSSSVSGGIREIGDTSISTSTFTINVTKGTNPVVSVKLFKDNVEVQDFADVENGGSFTYDGGAITTDTKFEAKANDGDGDVASTAISYKFVSPMYIGSSDNGLAVFSETDATALTKKIVDKNTKTIQAFTHTQQHMCFVVPNTWNGSPTLILLLRLIAKQYK